MVEPRRTDRICGIGLVGMCEAEHGPVEGAAIALAHVIRDLDKGEDRACNQREAAQQHDFRARKGKRGRNLLARTAGQGHVCRTPFA